MKIIGMGNALVDIITSLPNDDLLDTFGLPKGSMTLVDRHTSNLINAETAGLPKQKASGGSAANTIYGLANLGVESAFIGMVGDDDLGKFFYKNMQNKGIRPILFKNIQETGKAIALISPDSERTFATYLGAAVELSSEDINSSVFDGYDYLYLEGYLVQDSSLIEKSVRLARNNNMKICIDLASYNIVEQHKSVFEMLMEEYIDIVFANETEAEVLTGEKNEKALQLLGAKTEIAIVKTGAKGSLVFKDREIFRIEAMPAKPVDTTGAGDMYASGFLYGLSKGLSAVSCGKIGTILASKVIEGYGARMDEFVWENLRREIHKIEEQDQ